MTLLLRFAHLLALGTWVGGLLFFSLVAAPSLFGALPRDLAGRAVGAIFPRYHLFGAVCGGIALLALVLRCSLRGAWGAPALTEMTLLALMLLITVYAGAVVLPRASEARLALAQAGGAGSGAAQATFRALHRRSVLLNGAVLLLGVAAVGTCAWRVEP